jgi:glycosyltransferase involved in cell wall biosynthesis
MFYTGAYDNGFEIGMPYITVVHDLQHRLLRHFPELATDAEYASREYSYINHAANAMALVVDSDVGKEDVLKYYSHCGASADRIHVLPYLAPQYLFEGGAHSAQDSGSVRKGVCFPERYFFYPAQFWRHKNHQAIIRAMSILKRQGITVHAVFVGSNAGPMRNAEFSNVMGLASQLGVYPQVCYLGYVSNEEMAPLYRGAVGLIMPTYFGPTNIPPIEAWALGCPVIMSDIRGVREQAGDAAWLVNPDAPEAIAEALGTLWCKEDARRHLIERGRRHIAAYGPSEHRYRLGQILTSTMQKLPRIA